MAIIPYVAETLETLYGHTHLVSWTGLQVGDTGQPLGAPGASDRSVQVSGVFGSGGEGRITTGAGAAGKGFGSGGSGALSLASGAAAAGGAGTAGVIIVDEYA